MLESVGPASATDNLIYTIDVFMCGDCDPRTSLDMILQFYKADRHNMTFLIRGEE